VLKTAMDSRESRSPKKRRRNRSILSFCGRSVSAFHGKPAISGNSAAIEFGTSIASMLRVRSDEGVHRPVELERFPTGKRDAPQRCRRPTGNLAARSPMLDEAPILEASDWPYAS